MYINKKALLIGALFPILSIFFDVMKTNGIFHSLGLPFDFFWYMNKTVPYNRFAFFSIQNLLKINFRLDVYILDIVILYFAYEISRNIYLKAKKASAAK